VENIIIKAKKQIPKVDEIIEKIWEELNFDSNYIKKNFGEALIKADEVGLRIFLEYEEKALRTLAEEWLMIQSNEIRNKLKEILKTENIRNFVKKTAGIFLEFAKLVQKLEKDLGSMRKARGGKNFEKMVYKFLSFIGIRCEIPRGKKGKILGRIDIVIPSTKVAIETPDKAIFITCKRTLRERWKQEISQVRLNQRTYLITIDTKLPLSKAYEINEKGFIAYVRDELKELDYLKNLPWIRKLKDLPKELKI